MTSARASARIQQRAVVGWPALDAAHYGPTTAALFRYLVKDAAEHLLLEEKMEKEQDKKEVKERKETSPVLHAL